MCRLRERVTNRIITIWECVTQVLPATKGDRKKRDTVLTADRSKKTQHFQNLSKEKMQFVTVPDRVLHPRNGAAQSLWRNGKASRNLLSSNCEVESQNGSSIHKEPYKKTFKIW